MDINILLVAVIVICTSRARWPRAESAPEGPRASTGTEAPTTGGVVDWLGAYVVAHNGEEQIDDAVQTTLQVPQARKLVATMIQSSTRVAQAPWYVCRPIRALANPIAKWLIGRL